MLDITLESPDGAKIHLPVNPEVIAVDGGRIVDTVNILKIGEVPFMTGDKMSTIELSSFFPTHWDTFCQYQDIMTPREYWAILYKMKVDGKPCRLIVTDSPINTLVLIEDFHYEYRGGEMGDIYYTLGLHQWREIKIKTTKDDVQAAVKGENKPRPRVDTKPVPKTYSVKSGDSLWKIAKAQLGSGSKWQSIYNLNKKTIGTNPDKLKVGMKLVMPT